MLQAVLNLQKKLNGDEVQEEQAEEQSSTGPCDFLEFVVLGLGFFEYLHKCKGQTLACLILVTPK